MLDAPTMTLAQALDVLRPVLPASARNGILLWRGVSDEAIVLMTSGKQRLAEALAVILNNAGAQADRYQRATEDLMELRSKLREQAAEIERLKARGDSATKMLGSSGKGLVELEDKLASRDAAIADATNRILEISVENDELRAEIERMRADYNTVLQTWAESRERHLSAERQLAARDATIRKLREALEWYGEQAAGCRKLGSIGEPARNALDKDGGKRAARLLAETEPSQP